MKLLSFGMLLLLCSVAPPSARADQMWGDCAAATPASHGTQGTYYVWDEWHDVWHEFITHSLWHSMSLMPGETLFARVQPTSGFSIYLVFADLYDSCQPGAAVGNALAPTTFSPFSNPGRSITNNSGVQKTYWLQVYPWANGGYGYLNYNLDVVIARTGVSYCPGASNSVGSGGTLLVQGTNSVSTNNLVFNAGSMPPWGFAMLASGTAQSAVPFGDGTLCIAGSLQRLSVVPVGGAGTCSVALDMTSLPPSAGFVAGNLRYFQMYYRDSVGPLGTGFNLTNAMTVPLMP